jgi:TonB-linked SusC/RagA family outer membrane protein
MRINLKVMALPWPPLYKVLMAIRLTLAALLLSLASVSAESYSQTISLHEQNATLEQILQSIENQTGYTFFYKKKEIPLRERINIYVSNIPLEEALDACFKDKNITYKIFEKTIVLKKSPVTPAPAKAEAREILNLKIAGTIKNEKGEGFPGVNILVKGTTTGTQSDANGQYSLIVPDEASVLVFSYLGYTSQERVVGNATTIDITLEPDIKAIEEVVVVAYGTQKKESLVSAITTVNPKELKGATGNVTNAIAGRVAGVIAYQQSGEPGNGSDNSAFYIRGLSTFGSGKQDPLILIDNMESTPTDLARFQTDDIASFSVLKDASAAALYGARGANGVILITTKTGATGATKYSFRVENAISSNTKNYKMTDNISYMRDANEAAITRNPTAVLPYGENKINHTVAGDDPYLYPNNNWMKQMIKDYTVNQRYNLNISGGTSKTVFFIAGTYNVDNGILKVDPINNFNSNIKLRNYSLRSNVTFSLTPTTEFIVRMYGQFDDYTGPMGTDKVSGGAIAFQNALSSNPVMFPAVYPKSLLPYIQHPLFGSAPTQGLGALQGGLFVNPYAEMVRGYQTYKTSNIEPQIEIKQKLDFITKGLSASSMAYLQRYSYYSVLRGYNPFYYTANVDPVNPEVYTLSALNDGGTGSLGVPGTEYLGYSELPKVVTSKMYLQGTINYLRTFNEKHEIGALLTSFISSFEAGNAGSVTSSLPQRNTVTAGRFTYGYDSRYLVELNFGYNGSERFAKNHRFGFFPSIGVGYVVSNEGFFEPFRNVFSNLKFRASYGLVGNDQIGPVSDRFFYLSNVNPNDGFFGASFGTANGTPAYTRSGYSVARYGNNNVTWELSKQFNLGMDLTLFNTFSLTANAFKTYRSDIFLNKSNVESAQGLTSIPKSNYGKGETKGIDLTLNYTKYVNRDLSVSISGTFTYATSKVTKNDEIQYDPNLSYLSRVGYSFNQQWGFIAERLFVDDEEVANSPSQAFFGGEVRGGDIKYRDINKDGVINNDDRVAIGNPVNGPEIIYGFGPSITYKKLDFGFMFQGAARSTFFIDPVKTSPFIQFGGFNWNGNKELIGGSGYQNGELQAIHESHWTEENPDQYAFWPRLSNTITPNNVQQSTWWMRNGSFIRLKSVTLGYTFSTFSKKIPLQPRLYLSATNLFAISKFKLWDVEMGGNGLGYPVQSVYMMGLQINL